MIRKCKGVFGKTADAVGGEYWNGTVKQHFFPVGDLDKVYDLEQVSLPWDLILYNVWTGLNDHCDPCFFLTI